MKPILNVEKVEKYYGSKSCLTKALDQVSFQVNKGEFVGIMGPSGSGKTTLLNCISTIDAVSAGKILINDRDITQLNSKQLESFRRDELGFVFQDFNLLDTLTAYENIALALTIQNVPASKIDAAIRAAAKTLGITDVLQKYPYQMSGGQKQRVASARVLVKNPSLILADEPTGALDSKSSRMLLESFEQMNQELQSTILMVTHDSFTASYAHRILFIKDGRLFNGVLTEYIRDVGTVQLAGVTYRIKNDAPIVENIMTGSSVSYFYLIVPDSFTDFRDAPEEQRINFVCTGNDAERAEQKAALTKLLEYYETLSRNGQATVEPIAIYGVTNDQFQANIYGSAASLIFIGIYLGLIFLIASVAVLAIQQLSEASESIGRYRALQKMGVPDKLIQRSVLQQILFYFALPLGLAIVDSAFGIRVMGERFNQFHLSVFNGVSLIAMIIFAFIFSGYLYVTYKGYQNVIAKTHSIG